MKVSTAGGKGSATRPSQIDKAQFDKNFDLIFGKKEKQPPDQSPIQHNKPDHTKTK